MMHITKKKWKTHIVFEMWLLFLFAAVTVRFLTKRFIGEYNSNIGTQNLPRLALITEQIAFLFLQYIIVVWADITALQSNKL